MAALGFRLEDEEDDSTPLSVYAEKALEREQAFGPNPDRMRYGLSGMHSRTIQCDRRSARTVLPILASGPVISETR